MSRLSLIGKVTTLFALTCLMSTPAFAGKGPGKPSGKGDLQQWWQSLPQDEQQMMRDRYEIFKSLPEEKQQRLQKRWQD